MARRRGVVLRWWPPMSESRRAIVERAFNKLDKTGDGVLSVNDIRRVYSMEAHPRYMSGEETADVVMTRFLANFEPDGDRDGTVHFEIIQPMLLYSNHDILPILPKSKI
ncbi:Calcyphosin-like protein [Papilio machaon]|uniref:Calcyphosin-like protein n=1 Tax=Papilio machaon TaxID=76193 RepID=A0A0N1IJQ2_PAPMA|nr:Calcyphosin-like protein [Papilio machaon]